MSQNFMILEYMRKHGSITPGEAYAELGCMRLASRINELRNRGVEIRKVMEIDTNRNGETVRYARYSIERGNENG